jgi:hypothetical protein
MVWRPSDWSAVGLPSAPVPGDPEVVRQGGYDYRATAAAMRRAAAKLRGLQVGGRSLKRFRGCWITGTRLSPR